MLRAVKRIRLSLLLCKKCRMTKKIVTAKMVQGIDKLQIVWYNTPEHNLLFFPYLYKRLILAIDILKEPSISFPYLYKRLILVVAPHYLLRL